MPQILLFKKLLYRTSQVSREGKDSQMQTVSQIKAMCTTSVFGKDKWPINRVDPQIEMTMPKMGPNAVLIGPIISFQNPFWYSLTSSHKFIVVKTLSALKPLCNDCQLLFVPDGIYSVGDYNSPLGGCRRRVFVCLCPHLFFTFHDGITSKRFELLSWNLVW